MIESSGEIDLSRSLLKREIVPKGNRPDGVRKVRRTCECPPAMGAHIVRPKKRPSLGTKQRRQDDVQGGSRHLRGHDSIWLRDGIPGREEEERTEDEYEHDSDERAACPKLCRKGAPCSEGVGELRRHCGSD
eukprot:scaffold134123_cov32-Tisochrysis_lutea.AAC.4